MKTTSPFLLLIGLLYFSINLQAQRVTGEGPIVRQDLNIGAFHGIDLSFSGDVYIQEGNQQSVTVEGQQNLIDILNRDVRKGIWALKFDARNIKMNKKFKVYITMPTIDFVSVTGSGGVFTESKFSDIDLLQLEVSGSGDIIFYVDCNKLKAKVSGSGDIDLNGSSEIADFDVIGSGDIDGSRFKTVDCEANVTGSGDIVVVASDYLDARVTGSGDIEYSGSARVRAKVTGSGDIDRF